MAKDRSDSTTRERLAEVHQTDIAESRVNEDFLTWIKTKGPTWLLIIVAFIAAYLVMVRWQQQGAISRDEAWVELLTTAQPSSLEDVARQYPEIDAVADLALLTAGNRLLAEVRLGQVIDASGQGTTVLTDEQRVAHLAQAKRIYTTLLHADDGSPARTIATVSALNGLAAIAESNGDIDAAHEAYTQAASRAGTWLTPLAAQAQARADSLDSLRVDVQLATPVEPSTIPTPPGLLGLPGTLTPVPPPLGAPPSGPGTGPTFTPVPSPIPTPAPGPRTPVPPGLTPPPSPPAPPPGASSPPPASPPPASPPPSSPPPASPPPAPPTPAPGNDGGS